MKNSPVTTIQAYLERNILKQFLVGLTALAILSLTVTFFLSRHKMASDLQKSAQAAAEAFRSRILDGDIKAVESQIHNVLGLGAGEHAFILDRERRHIYRSTADLSKSDAVEPCNPEGLTCFDGYTGPGRIFFPIFFDAKRESLFGYLYLSKPVPIDWMYVIMVFAAFSLGYATMLFGLSRVARASSRRLSSQIETWAQRLRHDPKSQSPLARVPFAELLPLKEAIEGLTTHIEGYESKASEKAKLLVLRGIAHDLLSPVSQAQLYFATLERQMKVDPPSADTLNEIKSALGKVSLIASQVKTLQGEDESPELLNLSEAATAEVESLRKIEIVQSKDIRLTLAIMQDVLAPLSRSEVARILQNLVENAADASGVGAEITVRISSQGKTSLLSVEDRGTGIPPHLHQRIFEPDFTSKPSTGTGLGLFIVKHICERRNGEIRVVSTKNQGTTMMVSIPSPMPEGDVHAL